MGIHVSLRNEKGVAVKPELINKTGLLQRIIPPISDDSFSCLRFIDWHGFTIFNNLQMKSFIAEWDRVDTQQFSEQDQEHLSKVRAMAIECRDKVHLYLWFRGD